MSSCKKNVNIQGLINFKRSVINNKTCSKATRIQTDDETQKYVKARSCLAQF